MRPVSDLPIADYGLLSDCNSAALVSRDGSVDWLCFPRFDGPSVFGRLLDARAGHWSIRPVGEARVSRRYLDRTLLLESTFRTATGTLVLTDALAVGRSERGHALGLNAPRVLLRRAICTEGHVELLLELVPRMEYGVSVPQLTQVDGGVMARAVGHVLCLSSPIAAQLNGGGTGTLRFALRTGESAGFALQHRSTSEGPLHPWTQEEISTRLEDTGEAWRTWSELHQNYKGPWKELVHLGGRVLQGLTYQPTGAIIAAPTTSLPEAIGAERNWDYRFTWLRDAAMTLVALWVAACPDEAHRFFDFVADAAHADLAERGDLQIMFGLHGELDLPELELLHLSGWRRSRPVRIGNAASTQRQTDVYGPLLGAAHRLEEHVRSIDAATRSFLIEVTDTAAVRWKEKDQSIWEVRTEPQHFVYSKLMCWFALDRAIALADLLGAHDRIDRWRSVRAEIHSAILEHGWSDRVGAFTQAFGSDALDASNLAMPWLGFLPRNDPRLRSTVAAIKKGLTDENGLVLRYRTPDGLGGNEGSFQFCTFLLAAAEAVIGDVEAATRTFSNAAAFSNDLGLMSEQVDSASRELLGNFPQAFSHIGLIFAAWSIHEAMEGRLPMTDARPVAP